MNALRRPARPRPRAPRVPARLFLAALAAAALPVRLVPQGAGGIGYRVESLPAEVEAGEAARVTVVVRGLSPSGLEVTDPAVGEGLALEAKSIRPRAAPPGGGEGARGGGREVEIVLELRALAAGTHEIGAMELRGREGRLRIPPLALTVRGPEHARAGTPAFRWSVPSFVRRFEAFELSLEREDGQPPPPGASASFPPPPGLSVEPAGPFSWTAIALEGGEVELPRAAVSAGGKTVGAAPPAVLRIRPLPAELEPSRAIGRFSLALEGPAPRLAQGSPSVARLVLSGRGNQPALRLPQPRASIDGARLPDGALALRRIDSSRPSGGAYEGDLVLELTLTPDRPGLLLLAFDALPVLGPDGGLSSLSVPELRARVTPPAGPTAGPDRSRPSPFAEAAEGALRRLETADSSLGPLRGLVAAARAATSPATRGDAYSRALALLASSRPAARRSPEAVLLESALRWETGEHGEALALLYGLLRRYPRYPGARELAAACSGELGSGPPRLDGLPPPRPFAAAALALLSLSALLFAASRGRRPAASGALAAASVLSAALALSAAGLALASILQRRVAYAVLWTDRLFLVPSDEAETTIPVRRGAAVRLQGKAAATPGPGSRRPEALPGAEYVGVVLADNLAGWVRRDEVYYY